MEKEKRTWHYIQHPTVYEIHCDKCEGNHIWWSEYAHKIWCYDCEIDTEGFPGIFGGPIPVQTSEMMGISFDKFNMETEKFERLDIETNTYVPMTDKEFEKKWMVENEK